MRFSTSRVDAWRDDDPFELVEWARTGNSYPALVLDCDSREAIARAHARAMVGESLPVPILTITRKTSGHLHVAWLLRSLVHRGPQRGRGR